MKVNTNKENNDAQFTSCLAPTVLIITIAYLLYLLYTICTYVPVN